MSNNHHLPLGMTLLELLLAMTMLTVFTGVVATVMQFTTDFMGEAEPGASNPGGEAPNGVLIDHQQIHGVMDRLVDILQQPGISKLQLEGKLKPKNKPQKPQIAFDLTQDPKEACTAAINPLIAWGLPGPELEMPSGYRMCLWKTSKLEPSPQDLINDSDKRGGLYILQALPENLTSSSLPVRRVFCRPRPYC